MSSASRHRSTIDSYSTSTSTSASTSSSSATTTKATSGLAPPWLRSSTSSSSLRRTKGKAAVQLELPPSVAVSVVFAEREQGAPLRSAEESVYKAKANMRAGVKRPVNNELSGHGDKAAIEDPPRMEDEEQAEADSSQSESQSSMASAAMVTTTTTTAQAFPASPTTERPAPSLPSTPSRGLSSTSTPTSSTAPPATTTRRASGTWFRSFGRSRGNTTVKAQQKTREGMPPCVQDVFSEEGLPPVMNVTEAFPEPIPSTASTTTASPSTATATEEAGPDHGPLPAASTSTSAPLAPSTTSPNPYQLPASESASTQSEDAKSPIPTPAPTPAEAEVQVIVSPPMDIPHSERRPSFAGSGASVSVSSTPTPTPRKRSWFYKSTSPSSTPKETVVPVQEVQLGGGQSIEDVVERPLAEGETSAPTPTTPAQSTTPAPAPAPAKTPTRPPIVTSPSSSSTMSSLDDFVPPLPATPPVQSPATAHYPNLGVGGGSHYPNLNVGGDASGSGGLGGGTVKARTGSRFTLSIPLLGRAKIPLGVVLGGADTARDPKGSTGGVKDVLGGAVVSQSPEEECSVTEPVGEGNLVAAAIRIPRRGAMLLPLAMFSILRWGIERQRSKVDVTRSIDLLDLDWLFGRIGAVLRGGGQMVGSVIEIWGDVNVDRVLVALEFQGRLHMAYGPSFFQWSGSSSEWAVFYRSVLLSVPESVRVTGGSDDGALKKSGVSTCTTASSTTISNNSKITTTSSASLQQPALGRTSSESAGQSTDTSIAQDVTIHKAATTIATASSNNSKNNSTPTPTCTPSSGVTSAVRGEPGSCVKGDDSSGSESASSSSKAGAAEGAGVNAVTHSAGRGGGRGGKEEEGGRAAVGSSSGAGTYSSWWSYVGLGTSSSGGASPAAVEGTCDTSLDAAAPAAGSQGGAHLGSGFSAASPKTTDGGIDAGVGSTLESKMGLTPTTSEGGSSSSNGSESRMKMPLALTLTPPGAVGNGAAAVAEGATGGDDEKSKKGKSMDVLSSSLVASTTAAVSGTLSTLSSKPAGSQLQKATTTTATLAPESAGRGLGDALASATTAALDDGNKVGFSAGISDIGNDRVLTGLVVQQVEVSAAQSGLGGVRKESDEREGGARHESQPKTEGGEGGASAGSAWYAPWAWYSSSTTTTSVTAASTAEGTAQDAGEVDPAASGPDGTLVKVEEAPVEEDGSAEKIEPTNDPSPQLGEQTIETEDNNQTVDRAQDEPANPIEASIKANSSGWASFFSSQSLVKAIGYGGIAGGGGEVRIVKRDEHGAEVMDLDSEGESDSEDAGSLDGRLGRSLVPKLLTLPKTSSSGGSRDSSPKPQRSADDPPVSPLTVDEDLKRKVTQSLPAGSRAMKTPKSTSGASTPGQPPSPSGSAPPIGKSQSIAQPPLAEKSKSAPVTPKRMASPSPSTKKSVPSSPPNLVLPTWADTFHTPPRSVVLRPPSPQTPTSPAIDPGAAQDAGVGSRLLGKTMKFMSGVLFSKEVDHGRGGTGAGSNEYGNTTGRGKARRHPNLPHPLRRSSSSGALDIASLIEQDRKTRFEQFGQELPKSWEVIEGGEEESSRDGGDDNVEPAAIGVERNGKGPLVGDESLGDASAGPAAAGVVMKDVLRGCRRVVIIGVHGWFPGAMMRTVLGEPTGTSSKFANMMAQALQDFEEEHGVHLEKVTKIPLEGEGTIERRVERLYSSLISNSEWMDDLREADVIFVATHSQGSVVSTHLLDRLLQEKLIHTRPEEPVISGGDPFPASVGISNLSQRKIQRVCCLALCGIHLGPLRYLSSSSLVAPYIQYFESTAARELFDFQNTESPVSKAYVKALHNVLDHGVKMAYIASLNDQVVPIYSGIFTAASHPLILRALYIDGDAYHSSDFLSNLLVLLLRLRNCGISDGGLLAHLSEATAGSLSGVGHSTAYEDLSTYSLAVRYLFMTDNGSEKHPSLVIDHFNAAHEQNDYEIPWSLRDVIADERVIHFFSNEVSKLRDAFREWHPKTTILRDLKRKLQPIQRLPSSFSYSSYPKL